MGLGKTNRIWRWLGGAAVPVCAAVLILAMAQELEAKTTPQRRELTPWEQAERGLETLQAIPEGARTRADYARAMDGFRVVYHGTPGDVHAPDSVNAVAELLAEQGRRWHDAKSLKDAVGQYEFLRTQYPGSSLRVAALLAEGQIYENDLHDDAAARERYGLVVKQYPKSEQAEEARAGIDSLGTRDQGSGISKQGAGAKGRSGIRLRRRIWRRDTGRGDHSSSVGLGWIPRLDRRGRLLRGMGLVRLLRCLRLERRGRRGRLRLRVLGWRRVRNGVGLRLRLMLRVLGRRGRFRRRRFLLLCLCMWRRVGRDCVGSWRR